MKSVVAVIFLAGGLLLTSLRSPAQVQTKNRAEEFGSARERVSEAYGKLPLNFEANTGQANSEVKFLSRRPGYTLFLTASEAVLEAGKNRSEMARMKLVGSNPAPKICGLDELSGKSYYFVGNDPEKWQSAVPNYARVHYQAVYPGIDLIYYGNQRQLEYDFVVAPGADPKVIQLSFPGARHVRIDRDSGDLRLDCAGGEVRLHKPVAYQKGGSQAGVEARYVLKKGQQVGIALGDYDVAQPLIIDPILSYSTFLSGSAGVGISTGIAVDSLGNAYVTGYTTTPDFPTVHSIPAPPIGPQTFQGFVSKLSFDSVSSTLSLVYSTYLGGNGLDEALAIAVDTFGDAYVAGYTISNDFPVVHSLPASQAGGSSFVSKLSFDSQTSKLSLVYSTLLGGGIEGSADAIAVDKVGNAYVTGASPSLNFRTVHPLPVSSNPSNNEHTFVSKLSFDKATSTLSLVYSTFLCGGNGFDEGVGIAVDAGGSVYVTGSTNSPDFPAVHSLPAPQGAAQTGENIFVSKLNYNSATSKLSLVYSTFLGASNNLNAGRGIAVDANGDAYVTGCTGTTNFPIVHPLPIPTVTLQGNEIIPFVSKLHFDNGTSTLSLVYSTFLGGSSGQDEAYGIAVDSDDNAYVTGDTYSADFPIAHPLPAPNNIFHGPSNEVFVSKLNFDNASSTLSLAYSTFLGGNGPDVGIGIAVDAGGNAYVVGDTSSTNFPTAHPLPFPDNMFSSRQDSFVAKIGKNAGRSVDRVPW